MHGAAKTARVQECYDHVGNLAETARKHRVALSFVRKVTRAGFKHQAYKRISHKATPIRKRRSTLEKLRKTVSIKEHRKWAKFGTATKMRDELLKRKINVSVSTVRRDLRAMGCRCLVRKSTPSCRRGDLEKCKNFKKRVKREKIKAENLIMSDETYVSTHERTGRLQWMKPGERTHPMENNHKYSASYVMVWGAIGKDFKSDLVVFPKTMSKKENDCQKKERLAKKYPSQRRLKKVAYRMDSKDYTPKRFLMSPLKW